ncbi:hypothetical protein ACIBO6_07485 [Streptomyces luteogriseus]
MLAQRTTGELLDLVHAVDDGAAVDVQRRGQVEQAGAGGLAERREQLVDP